MTGSQLKICRRASAPAVIDNWETAVRKLSDSLDLALTARQQETLLYLSGALTVGHIAAQMGVSVATVRTHIQDVYTRLGPQVRSRTTARAAVIAHLQPTPDPVTGLLSRQLTTRQLDVMTRVNAGVRVPAIAAELGLSQATINRHLKMSLTRLGVRTQPEALVTLFGGPTVG